MPRAPQQSFLAERYWTGAEWADVTTAARRLQRAARALSRDRAPIRVVSSTWVPADEVVLTLIEAGEEDDVLEVGRRSGHPFDRLQRVEVVEGKSRRWRGDHEQV